MPTSTDRHLNAFKSGLLDNSENVVLCEADVPTSHIFRDVQAFKDTSRYLLSRSALTGLLHLQMPQKTLVSGAWKYQDTLKCLQIQRFWKRDTGKRDFPPIFCLYFCCRHTPDCSSNAWKGTEAVYVHEHNVQPEPSLCRTYQDGLISRLTTTMLFQSAPSTTRISLCLPAKHSVVPVVAWFVEVLITHSYHLGKVVMWPRSPSCASVSLSQTCFVV